MQENIESNYDKQKLYLISPMHFTYNLVPFHIQFCWYNQNIFLSVWKFDASGFSM